MARNRPFQFLLYFSVVNLSVIPFLSLIGAPAIALLIVAKPGSMYGTPMLKHQLLHPKINEVLGRAGHHAKVLIADGNYPASTKRGPNAELVCLNLMPGVVNCTQVLEALLSAVPIDGINTMMYTPDDPYTLDSDPPVWDDYRAVIAAAGLSLQLEPIAKWDFYGAVETTDHVLTIQTADQQRFANLLLSIGVR